MVLEQTLSNGLEVVVFPTNAPVASVQIWVDVGSIDENPQEAGYCHFLEHMLFKGTRTRTTAQIAGVVEGAGGEMNAFTSFEYTAYHITLSNKKWELAYEVLADMVLGSVFKQEEFNPEKEVILEEIKRGEDSPERQLYQGIYKMLWGQTGYGRPVIGYSRVVSQCTASKLKNFWKKWYSPALMTVVVCGDVDPVAVVKKTAKIFGRSQIKPQRARRRQRDFQSQFATSKIIPGSRNFPVHSVRWLGAMPCVKFGDPLLPAMDVASMVLGQGEASRLHNSLFRDKQLVTSVSAHIWAPMAPGMFVFDVETSLEKGQAFKKALATEVIRFCQEGPSNNELERAKVSLESDRIYGAQSMEALAHRLGFLKVCTGNAQYDLEYLSHVKELNVEDVRQASQHLLSQQNLREFALLPEGASLALKEESILQNEIPVHTKSTVHKGKPETIHRCISLQNGIDLVLFPRTDVPIVSLQACTFGGQRFEGVQTRGLGYLMAHCWEKGPQGWTPEKMTEFLESKASRLATFSGRNSTGLNATMLTRSLQDVLPVVVETMLNPAFDASEFERLKVLQVEDLKTYEDNLGRLVDKMFCETLFDGHPYGYLSLGTQETVSGFSATDIKSHYQRIISSSRMTVGIAGKFNLDQMIAFFENVKRPYFNKASNKKLPQLSWKAPSGPRWAEVKKNREQSHLILGYAGISVSDPDRYTLKVLSTVLGGQSGRLFTELRDKQGLCYVVAPLSFEGIEPGYVGIYMGCDPQKREQAIQGIRLELQKLVNKPISNAELQRAKDFMLGRHHMDMQLNSAIASTSSLSALYGLGYDEHLRYADFLKTVTAQSIQKLAKRIFTGSEVLAVVL